MIAVAEYLALAYALAWVTWIFYIAIMHLKIVHRALHPFARAAAMLTGSDYNGYQVSFTAADGNGMLQVESHFNKGITNTVIHFENGAEMPIAAADFPAFAAWFAQQRNGFFV